MDLSQRFHGGLIGLACGDAVGTTVEFKSRTTFAPVTDMVGGGPFRLNKGEWTDDTSMALCLAASLVEKNGFDARDQLVRYVAWMQDGYMSSNGRCFDIGTTVSSALRRYLQTGDPVSGSTNPNAAGNGSIMRLAPVPMFFFPDQAAVIEYSGQSSLTTHAAVECVDACRLFGSMLYKALAGQSKDAILFGEHFPTGVSSTLAPKIQKIADGDYRRKSEAEIEGTGYVVKSLEAALWSFWKTTNFRDAILCAVNLGDDADTTAAVCGQIAGAYYGLQAIPDSWIQTLALRTTIEELVDLLLDHSSAAHQP
jgi:ADP-ribosyl-[dinitrogen reductase] hydrolase